MTQYYLLIFTIFKTSVDEFQFQLVEDLLSIEFVNKINVFRSLSLKFEKIDLIEKFISKERENKKR